MISTAYAAEHAEHAVAHGHGPFYADPHFWVAAAFLLVVAFAWKPVKRAIAAALDARAFKIKARLEEAHQLREDAQEMLATYRRKQRDAMKEAEAILLHAKGEAERMAVQAAKDLEDVIKRREAMAVDRITQAEAQAVKEVQTLAVDVAVSAARQILAESVTVDQAARLVDSAILELPHKLH
jgi:F-type H+-transporting ATPase subunit b